MTTIQPEDVFTEFQARPEENIRQDIGQLQSVATARQYRWPYAVVQASQPRGSRILDWGCGSGHFSFFLLRAGYRVDAFALGPPPPLVAALEAEQPGKMVYTPGTQGEPVAIPYADATFNSVVSVGVLEHVYEYGGNELSSLREIHRILLPSGLFFCFHFPNRYSWIEAVTSFFPSRYHHLHRYTRRDIFALARDSGFEVLQVRRYNVIPRNIFGGVPVRWQRSRAFASLVDFVDDALSLVLGPFAQNYGFVLRKKG